MRQGYMIVDLQFGSCGKGLLAGMLAEEREPDTIITAWAPNAGHTYINQFDEKFVNTALPNGIVSPKLKKILLGPGSVINPLKLLAEIENYASWIHSADIMIHEHAAVVLNQHVAAEERYAYGIGSTMKGVGEAVIHKIRRNRADMNIAREALRRTRLHALVVSGPIYDKAIDDAKIIGVEGAQGFSLGINSGFYPYTTSRECTVAQLCVDCAIPVGNFGFKVYGVARTYPIRVANRFNDRGEQVGWSGPCYPDQRELEWKDIGVPPELTTVTKLPRRVFTFSVQQVTEAIRMNDVDGVFLNFCNYFQSANSLDVYGQVEAIRKAGAPVKWLGFGPKVTDIQEGD